MNKIMNRELEHYMGFRLQTVRRKKRMQHEDFEKKLFGLHKERNELYKQQRALGWIELHPPVMRGWKRFFVLREDVAKSKHGSFFEGILQKINKVEYSSRKDFKIKKRKAGRKIYVAKKQELFLPDDFWFKKLNFNEKEAPFFEVRYVKEKWRKDLVKRYVFTEPWRFVIRIRPNIITKVRVKDVEIERRISEINDFIDRGGFSGKLNRLLTGSFKWRWDEKEKIQERNSLKNKPLQQILEEHTFKYNIIHVETQT